MSAAKKQLSYEEMLTKLDNIVEKMENSDIPLNESLELYKEGVNLCVNCVDVLKKTRQEVYLVTKNGEKIITEAFDGI